MRESVSSGSVISTFHCTSEIDGDSNLVPTDLDSTQFSTKFHIQYKYNFILQNPWSNRAETHRSLQLLWFWLVTKFNVLTNHSELLHRNHFACAEFQSAFHFYNNVNHSRTSIGYILDDLRMLWLDIFHFRNSFFTTEKREPRVNFFEHIIDRGPAKFGNTVGAIQKIEICRVQTRVKTWQKMGVKGKRVVWLVKICDKNLKIKNHKLTRIIAHKNFSKWSIHHRNRRYLVEEDHKIWKNKKKKRKETARGLWWSKKIYRNVLYICIPIHTK